MRAVAFAAQRTKGRHAGWTRASILSLPGLRYPPRDHAARPIGRHTQIGVGMRRRDNVLRLRRFRVDELKRRLATLDAMHEDVERKLADLDESVARERQRAHDSDLARLAFPSFTRAMDSRRENLTSTLRETDRERNTARTDLADAWQELKALELAAEQEAKRHSESDLRRGQLRLDELALARQLRKQAVRQI